MPSRLFLPIVFNLAILSACGGGGGGGTSNTPPPVNTDNPPTVSWQGLSNNAVVSGTATLTVDATDDNSVSGVEFFVDSNSIGSDQSAPYELSWDTTSLSEGIHALRVVATDSANQTAESEISVVIDNLMPTVSITEPNNGNPLSGSVIIAVSCGNTDGEACELLIDGNVVHSAATESLSYDWDSTSVADGSYTITARTTDDAGNTAEDSQTVQVQNSVICVDKSENGVCDDQDALITAVENVAYPGAIWGDEVNGAQIQLCRYMNSAQPFMGKVRYNPNVVGALNTPDDVRVDLNDNGPSEGDRVAGDNQFCATITLNINEPVYYPYPTDPDGTVALMKFIFEVYDENGVILSAFELANNFGIPLTSIHSVYVVDPSASVPITDHSATVRSTSHVVNILNPAAAGCYGTMLQQMTNQLYGLFPTTPDPVDQFLMVKAGKTVRHANPQSLSVMDDVDHNSRNNFDNSAAYGSDGRLRAIACLGSDIGMSAALHEYAHPYAAYLPYQTGAHYHQSDIDQVGPLSRRGSIQADGPDHFVQVNVNNSNERNYLPFSKLTLRAMSLLGESEFGEVRYANRLLNAGERIHVSETTVVDNALLVQQFGTMNPSFAASRKDHRAMLVVMSDETGVVNDPYLSAVHAFAVYLEGNHVGEMFSPIAYIYGIRTGSFSWATGYRATLQMQLPPFN